MLSDINENKVTNLTVLHSFLSSTLLIVLFDFLGVMQAKKYDIPQGYHYIKIFNSLLVILGVIYCYRINNNTKMPFFNKLIVIGGSYFTKYYILYFYLIKVLFLIILKIVFNIEEATSWYANILISTFGTTVFFLMCGLKIRL